jgi:hypothetical protein
VAVHAARGRPSLADLATAISKQIQIAGPDAKVTVPPLAQAMFSDPVEHSSTDQQRRNRNRRRPQSPLQGTSVRRMHYAYVFETQHKA